MQAPSHLPVRTLPGASPSSSPHPIRLDRRRHEQTRLRQRERPAHYERWPVVYDHDRRARSHGGNRVAPIPTLHSWGRCRASRGWSWARQTMWTFTGTAFVLDGAPPIRRLTAAPSRRSSPSSRPLTMSAVRPGRPNDVTVEVTVRTEGGGCRRPACSRGRQRLAVLHPRSVLRVLHWREPRNRGGSRRGRWSNDRPALSVHGSC
jgi:hypothetical protein